jgi:alpha-tubulin suppressor-like RCC1 family protein
VPVSVKMPPGAKVVAIAAGAYDSLALTSSGAVYAWGYNADGELGNGKTASSDVPVKVKLPGKATAIAVGGNLYGVGGTIAGPGHGLALTSSGSVYAWGYNVDGQLGNGRTKSSSVPVKVKLPGKATAIAAGELHSLAMTSSGAVYAWGGNNLGQLGDGNYKGSDVPVRVRLP